MIKNEIELQTTQARINHFWQIIDAIRKTESNANNYRLSAGGFLAEVDKMNREVREYLSFHPSELQQESEQIAA